MTKTLPSLGYSIPNTKLVSLDKDRMSATGVFATEALDRVGDVLSVAGIITEHHKKNPVVLWNHGKEFAIPIGVTESPDKSYTVEIDAEAGEARATTFFSQHLLEAEQIYHLIEEGVIRAQSIGYRPLKAKSMPAQRGTLQRPGLFLEQVELLEVSWVGVPANQDAVRRCLDQSLVCGKSLSPSIRQALTPFLIKPKAFVRGCAMSKTAKSAATKTITKAGAKADPSAETPTPTPDAPPEPAADSPKLPLGAEMLTKIHDHLMMLVEFTQAETSALENEAVSDFLLGIADEAFATLSGIEVLFKSEYPDLPELPAAKAPEAKKETEKPAEEQKPEAGAEKDDEETDDEKPAEGKSYSVKRMTKAAGSTIRECAEHLDEMGGAENLTRDQKVACKYYGKALGELASDPESKDDGDDEKLTPEEKALVEKRIKKLELIVAHKRRLAKQKSLRRS